MSELLPDTNEESFQEAHPFSHKRACCPTNFLSPSRCPARTRARETFFDYDIGVLHPEQTVVDIPWSYEGNEKDSSFAKKQGKEEKKGEDPISFHDHRESQFFKSRRRNSTARFMCSVVCNPLLSSRLALMGILALLLILMTVFTWVLTSKNVHESVTSIAQKLRDELLLHTEDRVNAVLQGSDTSAISLAKFLGPLFNESSLYSFGFLQDQVRPVLFLIFSVLSKKLHATFLGANGQFLSFSADATGIYVSYANSSYLSPSSPGNLSEPFLWKEGENLTATRPWYKWYQEKVDEDTGLSVGEAITMAPVPYWDIQPVKTALEGDDTTASWGPSWVDSKNELSFSILSPVRNRKKIPVGVVSICVSMPDIVPAVHQFDVRGGAIYLETGDGKLVAQSLFSSMASEPNNVSLLSMASESGNPIVAGAATYLMPYIPSILAMANGSFTASNVLIHGTRYMIDSAPMHFEGLTLVCTVVLPHGSFWKMTEHRQHTTLSVLITLATFVGLVGCFFIVLFTKGISNEMRLRAALIQQLEETKRAEAKSNHKSLVFANMSHDLRTPLAAILGLIDLCLCDASELSELESNLIQMKSCATDLLGILNSILDMSKIEAGKLLLQDSGFDLVSALEEVVDTFSVLGLKKGVEVVLDLSDGFVEKASWVIGDGGRVKQIIANLLSNGVKFTSEGHVVLRAWVEPFDINNARPHFSYWARFMAWPWSQILKSPSREKDLCKLIQGFSRQEHDTSYLQVVFEVDDTGRGIPKERWKSVFENFVQVEPSGPRNYDGTGLGLGIVRSLVRLMGGDINIIDKDAPGEPGARFRFNLVFKCGKQPAARENEDGCTRGIPLRNASSFQDTFGVSNRVISPKWQLGSSAAMSFSNGLEVTGFSSPPIFEGVKVLLAMQGRTGRKVVKRWMERRGLQVYNVETWGEFGPAVERIKHDMFSESNSSSEKPDSKSPETHIYDPWVDELDEDGLTKTKDGTIDTCLEDMHISDGDGSVPMMNLQTEQAHLLLIIDAAMAAVPIIDLCSELERILLDADPVASFRVVWLVNVNTPSTDIHYLRNQTKVCHLILHKPLNVSRLNRIWSLLHDLIANTRSSGAEPSHLSSGNCEKVDVSATNSLYNSLSCMSTFQEGASGLPSSLVSKTSTRGLSGASSSTVPNSLVLAEGDEQPFNCQENSVQRHNSSGRQGMGSHQPPGEPERTQKNIDHHLTSPRAVDKLAVSRDKSRLALSTMHILVAEDNPILQRLTKTQLTRLGASVECVDNGAEAARLVLENLCRNKPILPHSSAGEASQMFDLVLMDCEMPILNGYEATQRIRSDERRYGIRTPVVALTAHAMAQDEKKCIESGMDFYLTKPLAIDALLDVVTELQNRNGCEFD